MKGTRRRAREDELRNRRIAMNEKSAMKESNESRKQPQRIEN
jgi:hypothetical protein